MGDWRKRRVIALFENLATWPVKLLMKNNFEKLYQLFFKKKLKTVV